MLKKILLFISLLIIASCSGGGKISGVKSFPIAGYANSNYFTCPVPEGWFTLDKSVESPDDLLLVTTDYNNTISFNTVSVNRKTLPEDNNQALAEIAGYSLKFRKFSKKMIFGEGKDLPDENEVAGTKFYEFSYRNNTGKYYNMILFYRNGEFIEAELGSVNSEQLKRLREVQLFLITRIK